MWLSLESARVWESCVFLFFPSPSDARGSAWGIEREGKWAANAAFQFHFHLMTFSAFSSWFSCQLCLPWTLKPASLCPLEQDTAQRTCRSVYRAAANVAHEERHLKRSQKCFRFTLVLGVIGLLAAILIQRVYWVWRNALLCTTADLWPLLSFCRPFLLE